jgi:hypothetical protein
MIASTFFTRSDPCEPSRFNQRTFGSVSGEPDTAVFPGGVSHT